MVKQDVWSKQYLLVWVFSVERGGYALVRTPAKDAMIIDCGGSDAASILPKLKKKVLVHCNRVVGNNKKETRLAQVILSHPHVDHITNLEGIAVENPALWTCPHDKDMPGGMLDEKLDWTLIENPEDSDELIEKYKHVYAGRKLPLQVFVPKSKIPGFRYGLFYIRPPECEPSEDAEEEGLPKADYGNNVSLMVFLRFQNSSIILPGDMLTSGMDYAVNEGCENRLVGEGIPSSYAKRSSKRDTFRGWVNGGCSVLVAPHHGLESGFPEALFDALPKKDQRVDLVVISERRHGKKTDGKIHEAYQSTKKGKVRGMPVKGPDGSSETRASVRTSSDGHCLIGCRGSDEISVVTSQDLVLCHA